MEVAHVNRTVIKCEENHGNKHVCVRAISRIESAGGNLGGGKNVQHRLMLILGRPSGWGSLRSTRDSPRYLALAHSKLPVSLVSKQSFSSRDTWQKYLDSSRGGMVTSGGVWRNLYM